jgi:hypothetical protein
MGSGILSPETVIVTGDKSTLIMRPVFGRIIPSSPKKTSIFEGKKRKKGLRGL